jgi:hypothetical protein
MSVKSDTQTVRLQTDAKTAYDFIADPTNLPIWAVGFCRSIRPNGSKWIVETGAGECPLEIDADPVHGTIDFHMEPVPNVKASAYSRIIECGAGSEYIFTQFSVPSAPEEMFAANVESLKEELVVLRSVLRSRQVCPA